MPSIDIEPEVGLIRPLIIRTSVDFPEPESPMTTKISPSSTVETHIVDADRMAVLFENLILGFTLGKQSERGIGIISKYLYNISCLDLAAHTQLSIYTFALSAGQKRSTTWKISPHRIAIVTLDFFRQLHPAA